MRPAVSLRRVAIVLIMVTLALGLIGFVARDEPDSTSTRLLIFGFGGSLLSGFVLVGIGCFRELIWRELRWVLPALWGTGSLAGLASLPSAGFSAEFVLPLALTPLSILLGGAGFLFIGWPVAILLVAIVERDRYSAALLWGCAAAVAFAATYPFVSAAVATPQSITLWGQGGEIGGAILGLNDLEIQDVEALWIARGFLVVAVTLGLVAFAHLRREHREGDARAKR